jgi:Putative beta-barrel porin-2, OmpL-like. bbp2
MSTRVGKLLPLLGGAALLISAQVARADELAPTEGQAQPYEAAEEAKEPSVKPLPGLQYVDQTFDGIKSWFDKHGLTIGSGLSTAFEWNFNNPSNFKTQYRFNDNFTSRYFVDLFQISLGYNPTPEKGQFGWFFKGDTGRIARRLKADWNGSGFVPDTSWEHDEVELQDAWVTYNIPVGNGLTLKGGKFDTLIGAEVAEPWLNPNFGRSLLYFLAEPITHTGGIATYPVTDMVSLTAGGVMGWDNVEDNNNSPSVIGQVAVVPNDKTSIYVNGIYGPEQACNPAHATLPGGMGCNSNKRGLVDAVATIKPIDQVSFILNYDWASEDEASAVNPGRHSTWQGFSGIIVYDPIKRLEFALRGEWFEDAQGSRTGIQQSLWEVTTSAKVLLSDHIYTRAEYRHDESDQKPFLANQSIFLAGQDTVALELGYYF